VPSGFGNRVVSYVSDINASTDLVVVGELMGIGILLTILSSCAAIIFILRYEPLKILSERS
jgi:putative ABC transport system permease protein